LSIYQIKLTINVPPRAKNPIFEDDNKSKELARLLKSKNPQDLEAANRIIKNMVKQDEIQTERVSNRMIELEHINNNIKLLNDMLLNYNQGLATESEKETIKYLYDELERHRSNLVKIATETEDDDDAINEILKTNDQSERIINQYKLIILKEVNGVRNSSQLDDVKLVNLNAVASFEDTDFNGQKTSNASNNSLLLNSSLTSEPGQTRSSESKGSNYDPLKELQDLFATPNTEQRNGGYHGSNDFNEFTFSSGTNSNPTSNIENLLSSISINPGQSQTKPVLTPTNLNPSIVQNSKPKSHTETSKDILIELFTSLKIIIFKFAR
jgi:hypothetical protein